MKETEHTIHEAIRAQAAEFQAREGRELTAEEKREFLEWLRDSPRNVHAYLESSRMLQLMPQAFEGLEVDTGAPLAAEPSNVLPFGKPLTANDSAKPKVWSRLTKFMGVAAATLLMAGVVWWSVHDGRWNQPTLEAAQGDQRIERLEDGSVILLNSQAQVSVQYSANERRVVLEQGQALFKVAKDPSRPFRVSAGSAEVVAVGTQFDVYRQAEATTVTVVEGKVDVLEQAPAASADEKALLPAPRPIRVAAGQQVNIGRIASASVPTTADVNTATAWVRRQIVFSGQPLDEVAAEFNRYLPKPLIVEDEALKTLKITGTFSVYDPETFLAFLREFDDVEVDETSAAIYVRLKGVGSNELR